MIVGTRSGLFVVRGGRVDGPHLAGQSIADVAWGDGAFWAAGGTLWRSDDGRQWRETPGPGGIWRIIPGRWIGTQPAALYRWSGEEVAGLQRHPTRAEWQGDVGGLSLHSIVERGGPVWVGISAVGVLRSDDGGTKWVVKNAGVPAAMPHPEIHRCVHKIDTDGRRLYRQDHKGVYVSEDGGDSWERREDGLPSGYGFTVACGAPGEAFVVPLISDENREPPDGALRVYRTTDGGASWGSFSDGLPREHYHGAVLRHGFAWRDGELALGTTAGDVFTYRGRWDRVAATFPRIQSVCIHG